MFFQKMYQVEYSGEDTYIYTKIANSYDAGAYDHDLNYAKNKLNRVSDHYELKY